MRTIKVENNIDNVRIAIDGFPRAPPAAPSSSSSRHVWLKRMTIEAGWITFKWDKAETNRILDAENAEKFLEVSFQGLRFERGEPEENAKNSKQPTGPKRNLTADYIEQVLKNGIAINGVLYNFFGHSNSQLKERKCALYADSKEAVWKKASQLGDFSGMKGVAKLAKRRGLLFSGCQYVFDVTEEQFRVIEDEKNDAGELFTDGCG